MTLHATLELANAGDARLGDIAEFVRGITFKPEDVIPATDADALLCMRTKNVQETLDLSDVWGIPASFARRTNQILREGDILISSANSWNLVGKCCWIPALERRSTFGGFVTVLRANPLRADPRYLFRWLSTNQVQATLRSFGRKTTSISNLDLNRTLDLVLPLPSLAEQRRIAAILDEADALRTKRRAALAQLDEMAQAIFAEMFGDRAENYPRIPSRALGDLVHVRGGKRLPKGEAYSPHPTPYRYIRVSDFSNGVIDATQLLFLRPETQQQIAQYTVDADDIIISIAGSIGAIAVVAPSIAGANLTENAAKLLPRKPIRYRSRYLADFLRSDAAQAQIGARIGQVTIGKLALFRIEQIMVPLPDLSLQDAYASRIDEVGSLRQVSAASLANLDSLFASLQHRAFRGEL